METPLSFYQDIFTVDGREGKDAFGYLAADTRPGALPLAAADQLTTASGDVAFILFSSGTTGLSKGVELSHANVMATILGMRYGRRVGDAAWCCITIQFSFCT